MRIVTAALVKRDGRFFIAQRKDRGELSMKWEFPGGKVDGDETEKDALRRELREELEVDAQIHDFFCSARFVYRDNSYELHAYFASFEGEPKALHDHLRYCWAAPEEFSKYDFADSDRDVIKELLKQPGK